MSKEYAIRILKEYLKRNSERLRLSFFGGETTFHRDIIKAAVEFVKLNWGNFYLLSHNNERYG